MAQPMKMPFGMWTRLIPTNHVFHTVGGRWSRQHRTELDGEERSVAYAPLGAKRLNSSKSCILWGPDLRRGNFEGETLSA